PITADSTDRPPEGGMTKVPLLEDILPFAKLYIGAAKGVVSIVLTYCVLLLILFTKSRFLVECYSHGHRNIVPDIKTCEEVLAFTEYDSIRLLSQLVLETVQAELVSFAPVAEARVDASPFYSVGFCNVLQTIDKAQHSRPAGKAKLHFTATTAPTSI
ncbi:8104_t:CDS:2, partial [Paraglomus brasilianum]